MECKSKLFDQFELVGLETAFLLAQPVRQDLVSSSLLDLRSQIILVGIVGLPLLLQTFSLQVHLVHVMFLQVVLLELQLYLGVQSLHILGSIGLNEPLVHLPLITLLLLELNLVFGIRQLSKTLALPLSELCRLPFLLRKSNEWGILPCVILVNLDKSLLKVVSLLPLHVMELFLLPLVCLRLLGEHLILLRHTHLNGREHHVLVFLFLEMGAHKVCL